MVGVPRSRPGADTLLEMRDDAIGDAGVYVGAACSGGTSRGGRGGHAVLAVEARVIAVPSPIEEPLSGRARTTCPSGGGRARAVTGRSAPGARRGRSAGGRAGDNADDQNRPLATKADVV
jgi:hypothetical protein